MSDESRPYRKKRRAETEAETRRRITESAVELHGTVGPSRTSISAIADRAGVRRSTLYRHFPNQEAVFAACSAHWREQNPPPDASAWAGIEEPGERLRLALGELYPYYRRCEPMLANLHRDEATVPIVGRLFGGGYRAYQGMLLDLLMQGRRTRGRRGAVLRGAVGHAIAFTTWRSLAREQGLDDAQAADLMCGMIAVAE